MQEVFMEAREIDPATWSKLAPKRTPSRLCQALLSSTALGTSLHLQANPEQLARAAFQAGVSLGAYVLQRDGTKLRYVAT